jgi:O-antigen/teichoic acid export membrane protein
VRLRIILRNAASNWVGYAVTLLVGFFLSPFLVHRLGNTGYGIWTLIVATTGYFGMLDLGIRSSVARFVARHVARADSEGVNRTMSTAFTMLACGGLTAACLTLVLWTGFSHFGVASQYQASARTALLIFGLNLALMLPMGVFGGLLIAVERFDVITATTAVSALVRAGLFVFLLRADCSLVALALAAFAVACLESGTLAAAAHVIYRPLHLARRYVSLSTVRELLAFSIYRFVWVIANQLIFYTDSLVIGIFLNATAVTYFSIAGSLINYGRNIVSLAADTLYPAATRYDSHNDTAGLQRLLIYGTRAALMVSLPLCIGYIFLGSQFITLWMGPGYAVSAACLVILTIPQVTGMSQNVSALVLAGMAKHKVLAQIALVEGIVNLVLSIVLVRRIGVTGVAWGTVVPHLISSAIVVPLYTLRLLGVSPRDYFVKSFIPPLVCAIPAAGVAYTLSILVTRPSVPVFIAEALMVVSTFAACGYFICLGPEQRALAAGKAQAWIRRPALARGA